MKLKPKSNAVLAALIAADCAKAIGATGQHGRLWEAGIASRCKESLDRGRSFAYVSALTRFMLGLLEGAPDESVEREYMREFL